MRSLGHKHTPSNVAESERGLEPSDAPCLLPTPTNKERSSQPGKTTGGIRGASGMPRLGVFPPPRSSLPLGAEAMCKQQHLNPKGWFVFRTAGTTCLRLIRHSSTLRLWIIWLKAVLGTPLFGCVENRHPVEAVMFLNCKTMVQQHVLQSS